jgi:hypothetical protein
MKEMKYDILEWVNLLSDSHISKEIKYEWDKILTYCKSDEFRVLISDEGVIRWQAKVNTENKIEYLIITD